MASKYSQEFQFQPTLEASPGEPTEEGMMSLAQDEVPHVAEKRHGHELKVATPKHSRESYNPSKSVLGESALNDWIRAPITGNLQEVPGIGDVNSQHLLGAKDGAITSTFELFGKFMMLKKSGVNQIDHCDHFFVWLKENAGISHRRDTIVQAVASKCNVLFPGIYDESLYEAPKEMAD